MEEGFGKRSADWIGMFADGIEALGMGLGLWMWKAIGARDWGTCSG